MKYKILSSDLFFCRTLDFFDIYLETQAGKSKKTVKSYRDALTIFRRFIYEEKKKSITTFKFKDCTYEFVLDYIAYLRTSLNYAPSSVNQRIAALKTYLCYAADCDISIQQSYLMIKNVPFLAVPKVLRPIMDKEVLLDILAAPKNGKLAIRDKMILILLFDTAIRVAELLSLKISDVNLCVVNPYIRVHGKGDKERIVAITKRTAEHLVAYILYFHQQSKKRESPLFYTIIKEKMNTMSERNVERIVTKYATMIRANHSSMPENISPHTFRRTRATGLYQDGVALELVSRILGHSSTITTRQYAVPSQEMLRNAMENTGYDSADPLWLGHEDELMNLCGLR